MPCLQDSHCWCLPGCPPVPQCPFASPQPYRTKCPIFSVPFCHSSSVSCSLSQQSICLIYMFFPLFSVAFGGAVVRCLTCQPGCERAVGVKEAAPSGASSFTRVPASEGLTARGSSCREAVHCSSSPDPSFYLVAPASSSKQCQVSSFCLCLRLKILSLLPAVVQQPTNL